MQNMSIQRTDCIFIEKRFCLSGPSQFKPMKVKGQLHCSDFTAVVQVSFLPKSAENGPLRKPQSQGWLFLEQYQKSLLIKIFAVVEVSFF